MLSLQGRLGSPSDRRKTGRVLHQISRDMAPLSTGDIQAVAVRLSRRPWASGLVPDFRIASRTGGDTSGKTIWTCSIAIMKGRHLLRPWRGAPSCRADHRLRKAAASEKPLSGSSAPAAFMSKGKTYRPDNDRRQSDQRWHAVPDRVRFKPTWPPYCRSSLKMLQRTSRRANCRKHSIDRWTTSNCKSVI